MIERSKKRPHSNRVSWISLNFGILILLLLMAVVGWAAWYLPRDRSSEVKYKMDAPSGDSAATSSGPMLPKPSR